MGSRTTLRSRPPSTRRLSASSQRGRVALVPAGVHRLQLPGIAYVKVADTDARAARSSASTRRTPAVVANAIVGSNAPSERRAATLPIAVAPCRRAQPRRDDAGIGGLPSVWRIRPSRPPRAASMGSHPGCRSRSWPNVMAPSLVAVVGVDASVPSGWLITGCAYGSLVDGGWGRGVATAGRRGPGGATSINLWALESVTGHDGSMNTTAGASWAARHPAKAATTSTCSTSSIRDLVVPRSPTAADLG